MEDTWDEYIIEGTDTLKNKLGITDKDKLSELEKEKILPKLTYLHINPIFSGCDSDHLKNIHNFLFEDIYEWAGEYRTCTLRKNMYNFLEPELIEEELEKVIERYNNEINKVKTPDEYAFVLAPFYYDLIRIHPFREGNGRSIREFIREVVLEKNAVLPFDVELDYTKIDKNNLLMGTMNRYFYPSLIETEFLKGLIPLEKEKMTGK